MGKNKSNLLSARTKKAIDLSLEANSPLECVLRKVKTLQIPGFCSLSVSNTWVWPSKIANPKVEFRPTCKSNIWINLILFDYFVLCMLPFVKTVLVGFKCKIPSKCITFIKLPYVIHLIRWSLTSYSPHAFIYPNMCPAKISPGWIFVHTIEDAIASKKFSSLVSTFSLRSIIKSRRYWPVEELRERENWKEYEKGSADQHLWNWFLAILSAFNSNILIFFGWRYLYYIFINVWYFSRIPSKGYLQHIFLSPKATSW